MRLTLLSLQGIIIAFVIAIFLIGGILFFSSHIPKSVHDVSRQSFIPDQATLDFFARPLADLDVSASRVYSAVAFSDDGRFFLGTGETTSGTVASGATFVFDFYTKTTHVLFRDYFIGTPDFFGPYVLVVHNGVTLFNADTGEKKEIVAEKALPEYGHFSPNGASIVLKTKDSVLLYDIASGTSTPILSAKDASILFWFRDGHTLLAGLPSDDASSDVYTLSALTTTGTLTPFSFSFAGRPIAFRPFGKETGGYLTTSDLISRYYYALDLSKQTIEEVGEELLADERTYDLFGDVVLRTDACKTLLYKNTGELFASFELPHEITSQCLSVKLLPNGAIVFIEKMRDGTEILRRYAYESDTSTAIFSKDRTAPMPLSYTLASSRDMVAVLADDHFLFFSLR